jgi:hypothetical protein
VIPEGWEEWPELRLRQYLVDLEAIRAKVRQQVHLLMVQRELEKRRRDNLANQ